MLRRLSVFVLISVLAIAVAPKPSMAASKEIQELQRDISLLSETVKQLQQSQDKQLAALSVLVQQAVNAAQQANTSVAVIQSNAQENLKKQQSDVVAPVVGLTSRMNGLSDDMRTLTQAVSDLASQISKIQSQLTDVSQAVKAMSQPPVQPPPQSIGGAPQGPGGPVGAAMPPMSSQDLYQQALGDRNGGKLDLALQEFSDFLKYYGNTDLAPNAQFYIANIHYSQGAYEQAASEFDMVLEKYPENNKTRDAMLYKGMSLLRAGKRTQASEEFKDIITHYPRTDQATQACTQLTGLGIHCPTGPASAKPVRKKKGL